MDELLSGIDLDPLLSPVGLVVVLIGIRMLLGAVKTAVKLVVLAAILAGLYLFFFGGQITG